VQFVRDQPRVRRCFFVPQTLDVVSFPIDPGIGSFVFRLLVHTVQPSTVVRIASPKRRLILFLSRSGSPCAWSSMASWSCIEASVFEKASVVVGCSRNVAPLWSMNHREAWPKPGRCSLVNNTCLAAWSGRPRSEVVCSDGQQGEEHNVVSFGLVVP
jgi:hypothetical protein